MPLSTFLIKRIRSNFAIILLICWVNDFGKKPYYLKVDNRTVECYFRFRCQWHNKIWPCENPQKSHDSTIFRPLIQKTSYIFSAESLMMHIFYLNALELNRRLFDWKITLVLKSLCKCCRNNPYCWSQLKLYSFNMFDEYLSSLWKNYFI